MTGECKKLLKPYGVIRKRGKTDVENVDMGGIEQEDGAQEEELEIVEVVRYKVVFSARPEPISGVAEVK